MKVRRRIRRQVRQQGEGINVVADVNLVVEGNVGRSSRSSSDPGASDAPDATDDRRRTSEADDPHGGGEQHG